MKINKSDVQRFYSKIETVNGCWNWVGGKAKKSGRGRFYIDGKTRAAYVVSYVMHTGEVPSGMYVCHECDNPSCVNPQHLFLGTSSDNMKDMFKKGRKLHKGELAPAHKVSNHDVTNIRSLFSNGMKQKDIASIYGITQSNVSKIVHQVSFVGIS